MSNQKITFMKAYHLYKIDPPKISPGNDFKAPYIPNGEIDMEPGNVNSDQNLIPNKPKNGLNPFPWKTVCVIVLLLIVTYIIIKTPREKITEEDENGHHQV